MLKKVYVQHHFFKYLRKLVQTSLFSMLSLIDFVILEEHISHSSINTSLERPQLQKSSVLHRKGTYLNLVLRRISSPRTKLLAARCECMHEHFQPITMLNS